MWRLEIELFSHLPGADFVGHFFFALATLLGCCRVIEKHYILDLKEYRMGCSCSTKIHQALKRLGIWMSVIFLERLTVNEVPNIATLNTVHYKN